MIYSLVIPELQQRGRYKTEYATGSLRNKLFAQGDHLPASHPADQFRCRPITTADDLKKLKKLVLKFKKELEKSQTASKKWLGIGLVVVVLLLPY
jgi:hypothetical protein